MRIKSVSVMLLIFLGSFVFADDYQLIKQLQIGPGTIYSYYEVPSRPWKIHVAEIDLKNPYITLETVKANDKMRGFETVSSMSKRNDESNHRIVMATNGDFYNTSNGVPINNQVANGEFVRGFTSWSNAFSYSEGGIPDILSVQFSGKVLSLNGSGNDVSYPLQSVNMSRGINHLVIYNNFYYNTTLTNSEGYECSARAISDWIVNDTVFAVIEACEDSIGDMGIQEGRFVLSGQGAAGDFLKQNCQLGDTVRIIQKLANSPERLTQLVGGGAWFLQNGVDVISPSDVTRHPRTGVGYSADLETLYLMVVDGRSSESIGMDYHHMADFLLFMGAWHGLNLDGGGSSSFVVRNSVQNDPSDGGERSVANSVLCVSSAPNGSTTHLQIARDSIAVYKNKSIDLDISGWDEHFNPTGSPDWSQVSVNFDETLGTFSQNIFTAKEKNGDTFVKTEFNGEYDSIKVHIIELSNVSVYPDTLTLDSVNSIEYQVTATTESGGSRVFDNDLFTFTVLDPAIAEVDSAGVIIGKQSGETNVIVAYGEETDTVRVNVQIGEGEIVVDEIENISAWTLSTDAYIDDANSSISLCDRIAGSGSKAIQVDYTRTGSEDGNIYLETPAMDLYGVPSYILIDVEADSNKNWIYALMEDYRGVEYSVKCASSLKYKNEYRTQYLDLSKMLPADGEQLYPLKFKGIRLRIDDKATTGSMYIDRVRIIYPTWTAIEDHDANVIPKSFNLLQNYPNPFNPSTSIDFQLSLDANVDLSIYSLSGRKITTLLNGYRNAGNYTVQFDASHLAGGLYFYRLQAGNWVDTKKMLLIK